ncbi:MAG: DUF2256 domain-containing protein [Lewinellaceae bacterium]|nr:DUF2256 domain-containing protein [Lewinellaceae bacterium]
MKKQHLPEKQCIVCGRPFTWRKKWEKVWEEVKYCSDQCRMNKTKRAAHLRVAEAYLAGLAKGV